MRRYSFALAILFCAATTTWAEDEAPNEDATAIAESVQFDGQTLLLANEAETPAGTIKEFIPASEKIDSWTKLAAVYEYPGIDSPKDFAGSMIAELQKRSADTPVSLIEQPGTDAVIMTFIVWPENRSPEDELFVEFNVFKYEKRPGGGLVAQQYALRAYHDIKEFLDGLEPVRERVVAEMAQGGLERSEPVQVLTSRQESDED